MLYLVLFTSCVIEFIGQSEDKIGIYDDSKQCIRLILGKVNGYEALFLIY